VAEIQQQNLVKLKK